MKVKKLLAYLLATLMIFSVIPSGIAFAAGTEGGPVNVLLNTSDKLKSVEQKQLTLTNGAMVDDAYYWVKGAGTVNNMNDGNTTAYFNVRAKSGQNVAGSAVFTLTESIFIDHVSVYAASGMVNVYAGNDLSTIIQTGLIQENVSLQLGENVIPVNASVTYIIVAATHTATSYLAEIQAWTPDSTPSLEEPTDPQNLLHNEEWLELATPCVLNDYNKSLIYGNDWTYYYMTTTFAQLSDGVITDFSNIRPYDGNLRCGAALYTFVDSTNIEFVKVYADNSTIRVFAGDNLNTLISDDNVVADTVCAASGTKIEIGKKAKYVLVAFIKNAANGGNVSISEIEVWNAEPVEPEDPEGPSDPQNLLHNEEWLESATPCVLNDYAKSLIYTAGDWGYYYLSTTIAQLSNGVITDFSSVRTYDGNMRCGAALYTFAGSTNIEFVKIYANNASMRVFAGDNLNTLISNDNVIADTVCAASGTKIEIGKRAKYILVAFIGTGSTLGISEIEVWNAEPIVDPEEPEDPLVVEDTVNFAQDMTVLESATPWVFDEYTKSLIPDTNDYHWYNNSIEKISDGNTATAYSMRPYANMRCAAVLYTMKQLTYVELIKIYATDANVTIYAGNTLATLLSPENIVTNQLCTNKGTRIAFDQAAKYILIAFRTGTPSLMVSEVELWSVDPDEPIIPQPPVWDDPESLKILTIGNSFAQNASTYASEIAAASGKELTFAYLKVSSCTIAKHLDYATRGVAPYQFTIVSPDGSRQTLTNEDTANETAGVTLEYALTYDDWDYIIFQEGSTSTITSGAFSGLNSLASYVRGFCPDARFALHETWSWAVWEDIDSGKYNSGKNRFSVIEANTRTAAEESGILTVIPTGLAFNYARGYLNDNYALNTYDSGNYQHANNPGCYLAGACYVATLFGIDIMENTVGNGHANITVGGTVEIDVLRTSVAKAMNARYPEQFDPVSDPVIPETPVQPETATNLFGGGYLKSLRAISQYVSNGTVETSPDNGFTKALGAVIDGNLTTVTDCSVYYDSQVYQYPKYTGIEFTLKDVYDVDKFLIYSGIINSTDTYKVYASDNFADLYSVDNLIAQNVQCNYARDGAPAEVTIGKSVKYIAVLCTGIELYYARPYEFMLMSSETEEPEPAVQGDLNGDDIVDVRDLIRLKKLLASAAELPELPVEADVNKDGLYDALDLTCLRKILLNIPI